MKRLHMICGMCGSTEFLKFKIKRDHYFLSKDEEDNTMIDTVIVYCDNCNSITELDDVIKQQS